MPQRLSRGEKIERPQDKGINPATIGRRMLLTTCIIGDLDPITATSKVSLPIDHKPQAHTMATLVGTLAPMRIIPAKNGIAA
jgi:hypothetical protein